LVEATGVTVIDRLPMEARDWQLSVPLGPEGRRLTGLSALVEGQENPFAGWMSSTYGEWHPSPWLTLYGDAGWHVWGAGAVAAVEVVSADHLNVAKLSVHVSQGADDVVVELSRRDTSEMVVAPRA